MLRKCCHRRGAAVVEFALLIPLFLISFVGVDQRSMEKVAKAGGGKHFHANTRAELINVFDTIASFLPTLIVE